MLVVRVTENVRAVCPPITLAVLGQALGLAKQAPALTANLNNILWLVARSFYDKWKT
jgi:hypothetical protein